jgi:hypothetical protein
MESLEQNANKYEKIKEQNRERQKRYYDKHKGTILEKKQKQRNLLKQKEMKDLEIKDKEEDDIARQFSLTTFEEIKYDTSESFKGQVRFCSMR